MHYYWKFFIVLCQRFYNESYSYRASALTFTTLLALVPLFSVSFTILSAFSVFQQFSKQVEDIVFTHFVAGSQQIVQQYFDAFIQQASKLSVTGLLFLIFTALLMIRTMEGTFNAVWKVRSQRRGVPALLLYWAVLTLAPLLLAISLTISSYLFSLPFLTNATHLFNLQIPLLRVASILLTTVAFTLLYAAIPNCYVPVRNAFIAAIVTALLFELAKKGFTFYVERVPSYQMIYGALAVIPLFLVWIYCSWIIILFGVLLSNMLTVRYSFQHKEKLPAFVHALRWLGYFWQAQQTGKTLSLWDLLNYDDCNYEITPERQLTELVNRRLIHSVGRGRYLLSRDLNNFTLRDFYNCLPWPLPHAQEWSEKIVWEAILKKTLQKVNAALEQDLKMSLGALYSTLIMK